MPLPHRLMLNVSDVEYHYSSREDNFATNSKISLHLKKDNKLVHQVGTMHFNYKWKRPK